MARQSPLDTQAQQYIWREPTYGAAENWVVWLLWILPAVATIVSIAFVVLRLLGGAGGLDLGHLLAH